MAATRLIALHANKGKTIARSLGDRTDYARNPEKTEKGDNKLDFSKHRKYTIDIGNYRRKCFR